MGKNLPIPNISGVEFILWLLRQRQRVKVINRSMMPTLHPGDEVLFQGATSQSLDIRIGDIVVVRHPRDRQQSIIKRVHQIHPGNQLDLRGDNLNESTDSRHFGTVPRKAIIGKVTCLFSSHRSQVSSHGLF